MSYIYSDPPACPWVLLSGEFHSHVIYIVILLLVLEGSLVVSSIVMSYIYIVILLLVLGCSLVVSSIVMSYI